MVKTQFSSTIKTLRLDGGGEYTSKSFESFLCSNGINHQISCPYTPQQNGLVERKHRHLIETTTPFFLRLPCLFHTGHLLFNQL